VFWGKGLVAGADPETRNFVWQATLTYTRRHNQSSLTEITCNWWFVIWDSLTSGFLWRRCMWNMMLLEICRRGNICWGHCVSYALIYSQMFRTEELNKP
jgi:hypothetical protein